MKEGNTENSENTQQVHTMGRRNFLSYLLGFSVFTTLAGILTPIIAYLIPPPSGSDGGGNRMLVGTTQDIPVGHGKIVSYGSQPVVVTNTPKGVKAFSAICTHLGCIVMYDQDNQIIKCPCHDGFFNVVTGEVISGPPPSPLPPIPTTMDGEDIYIGAA